MSAFDLENLLNLDGEIFPMENGYWTKFETYRVEPNENIPHGICYSLSLHDRNKARVIGFDNAHGRQADEKEIRSEESNLGSPVPLGEGDTLRVRNSRPVAGGFLGRGRGLSGRTQWLREL